MCRLLHLHGHACQIEILSTTGDRRQDVSLAAIGGKGLFTLELEQALLDGSLDLAVHSLKDVPTVLPDGLRLVAMLEREDARDALVAAPGTTLLSLPAGARVGTSSLRRQAQGCALRPDLQFVPIRGNVDTRLRRWRAGDFDALLLAAAGLKRLGHADAIAEWLDPEQFCPAAGQGVLALEARSGDTHTLAVAAELHHGPTALAVAAERALLARLECGCQAPVAVYGTIVAGALHLQALVASPDGTRLVRRSARLDLDRRTGTAEQQLEAAQELGRTLAEELQSAGAADILRAIYA